LSNMAEKLTFNQPFVSILHTSKYSVLEEKRDWKTSARRPSV
jgi:hypothetical protein